jgi:hypothetical protein
MRIASVTVGLAIGLSLIVSAQEAVVRINGAVPRALSLTEKDLAAMPRTVVKASAHDQEGSYEGVAIRELLTRAGVPADDALRGVVSIEVVAPPGR